MNEILKDCSLLNNEYSFWFHNPNDTNWSIESYHEILHFTTIEEFWVLMESIKKEYVENGMFFMMRDSTKPIWEDDQNCMGGCWSYKVDKKDVYRVWIELSAKIIAEDTVDDENWDLINGISISPKKTFLD